MNRLLSSARYVSVIPAIATILGGLSLMVQGSIGIFRVIIEITLNPSKIKPAIVQMLTAVDGILLGTVLLVIGYGLYTLFIDDGLTVPAALQVRDLHDLKAKLTGVVVAIISVVFTGVFVDTNRASDVIATGVGAGAILTGLALFAYATRNESSKNSLPS